jgi:hypothetical protein
MTPPLHPGVPDHYAELSGRLMEDVRSLQREPPTELFHYTTPPATQAIIESGRLWATHAAYLNDASELSHCRAILDSLCRELAATENTIEGREYLRRSVEEVASLKNERQAFVMSFCQEGDLLSQWRSYAGGATGYALGFSSAGLIHGTELSVPHPTGALSLVKVFETVNYDGDRHRKTIRALVVGVLQIMKDQLGQASDLPGPSAVDEALSFTREHLPEYETAFKNPAFCEEKEWRLVIPFRGDSAPWSFRTRGPSIVPFLNVRLAVREGSRAGKLPLSSVRVGPTTPPLTEDSLRILLDRHGYSEAKIGRSQIPLRWGAA